MASDPALTAGQYSIGNEGGDPNALVYGSGTFMQVSNTSVDPGSATVQDQDVVGHDGMLFGVDTMPGMTITQTGQVWRPGSPAAAMDTYSQLAGKWNDPAIRLTPGAVQVLRAYYPVSSVVRRCYGRGRKIQPVLGLVFNGLVPFTAQFQAADGIWYSDQQSSVTLTMLASFPGTLTPPLTPPYQLAVATNNQQNVISNTGTLPTWPVITFTGPVSYPYLLYVNTPVKIKYNGILAATDTLVIDTRPWARTVKLNGASVAGKMLGDPMIGLQLQPGLTTAQYGGQDWTGTSNCKVAWRSASASIGGST